MSGILIDSFVYKAIGNWHWSRKDEQDGDGNSESYEQVLLKYYNNRTDMCGKASENIYAPGSMMKVDTDDWDILGKVINKMV